MFRARLHARCNRPLLIVLVHLHMQPGRPITWRAASQLVTSAPSCAARAKNAKVEELGFQGVRLSLADIEAGYFGSTAARRI